MTYVLPIENEPAAPNDKEHRIMRELNLTVAGCPCRRCSHLRDLATLSMSKFGEEGDDALEAIDRMNRRSRTP